jgi:type I restriction enzyme, S subunit
VNRIEKLIQKLCPAGVSHVPLGEVANLRRGSTITKNQTSPGDVPVIAGGQKPAYWHNKSNRDGETIVVAGSGAYAGFVSYWDRPIFVSDAFTVSPNEEILMIKYVYYFLLSKQSSLHDMKEGSGVPHVYPKDAEKLIIPVPPLRVQQEIILVLERFTELEAELEAKLQAELEDRLLQGTVYRNGLLTFDSGIEWCTLEEIAEYANGKAHEKLVNSEGTIPLITARFISRNGEANRYLLPGDVLTSANKGDVALVLSDLPNGRALARSFYIDADNSYAINQRIARLRVKDSNRVDPKFMFYVLDRNPDLMKHDNGVDQTHLSKKQVTELRFPVPQIESQRRIVRLLDSLGTLLNGMYISLPAEIRARRKQYEYYRNKLLTFKELDAA